MRHVSLALCAHVDAGKTTLSEALLYASGAIRRKGRVDHGDAFLDTDPIERDRGITIFSKLARLQSGDLAVTLMDTPGHVDFAAEAERTLAAADAAVLVVSASQPVQGHTRTLWSILRRFSVPTFIFANKMDLAGAERGKIMDELRRELSPACAVLDGEAAEEAAMADEAAMDEYLEGGLSDGTVKRLIGEEKLFPVLFGSALRDEGVAELLDALRRFLPVPERGPDFGALAYKIARDPAGARLTYLKITGGALKVKDSLDGEKCDQIRAYSGEKYTLLREAEAGDTVAVTGLEDSWAGKRYGSRRRTGRELIRPVIRYSASLGAGVDPHRAYEAFKRLQEEEPQLSVELDPVSGGITVGLMGEVQSEVIERIMRERYSIPLSFTDGGIVYRETIEDTVEGVGHFEPLRHYAEVHLILEPGERDSGITLASSVPEDELDRNWQRLILTHLAEKQHLGVLTGSPITDIRITLAAGRAHIKHTEGGDFREATYRAVRQGLMQAKSALLEPYYDFTLELPQENVGRALSDLVRMEAAYAPPETGDGFAVIKGSVPASELLGYDTVLASYTRGLGRLTAVPGGFKKCHNAQAVIDAKGYDPERDEANPSSSVFCSHGAGVIVKWGEVKEKMHIESVLKGNSEQIRGEVVTIPASGLPRAATDRELQSIFERTYGRIERRDVLPSDERKKYEPRKNLDPGPREIKPRFTGAEYLLVDGYNIIFAWDELKKIAEESVDAARKALMDVLSNFRGIRRNELILVFDAYKVSGGLGSVQNYHGISVVYTKEAETADTYIEKTAHKLSKSHKVYVATSDGPEQMIILGSGALRMTAMELKSEIEAAKAQIGDILRRSQLSSRTRPVEDAFRKAEKTDK